MKKLDPVERMDEALFKKGADALLENDIGDSSKVHIRVQQRNGRKMITTVAGLADDLDHKRILKALKKMYNCNGAMDVEKDEDGQETCLAIQLTGDQRENVKTFLTNEEICKENQIVVHGY